MAFRGHDGKLIVTLINENEFRIPTFSKIEGYCSPGCWASKYLFVFAVTAEGVFSHLRRPKSPSQSPNEKPS